jgi:MEDS: MEthanogen/methylotroph, DcmR Sensory domain
MTDAREPTPHREAFPFGLDGVDIEPGDHIGCFYRGEVARDAVWLPYLRTGMHAGDTCVCLIDTTDPEHFRARVDKDAASADSSAAAAAGALDVQAATDAYLEANCFSTERMIRYLADTMDASLAGGRSTLVRATGEMSWVLRGPAGSDEFFDYEHALNEFASKYRQVLLCMYDLERFGVDMLMDAIRAHPKLLVGGLLADNPWYEPNAGQSPRG